MNDGWLCDSILKTAAKPSPMSTTPAFSPGPWMTRGPLVGRRARWTRELLYEQCSLHMTLSTPSSVYVGTRPRCSFARSYSEAESLCDRTSSGVTGGSPGNEVDTPGNYRTGTGGGRAGAPLGCHADFITEIRSSTREPMRSFS